MTRGMRRAVAAVLCCAGAAGATAATVEVEVVNGAGRPVADAVVFLESPAARAAARPLLGVEVAQARKAFVPAVSVVTVGTAVSFPNRDAVRHHVYSFSPIKPFEIKLYTGRPANPVVFDRAGVAVLGCNIHDTMAAWLVVVETPHHAVGGAEGRVRLENVPPGAYRLRTWHPRMPVGAPALEQALQVGAANASARVTTADP